MSERNESNAWYRRSSDEVFEQLGSSPEGLSDGEAKSRLDEHGPNAIRQEEEVSPWKVLLDQFTSPLIYVLLAALVVTLAIQSWDNAIVIGIVLVVNGTIGFIQEYRAESAVQSLMEMVSPKARVRRDGSEREIDGSDLVPGDLVLLSEGDMIPADVRLVEVSSLQVNESALTGESVPVPKRVEAMQDAEANLPPADQENVAFMGTAVTSGRGEGVVVATGAATQLGEIAEDVRSAGEIQTPLQRRMDRLAKWIAVGILGVAAVAMGVGLGMGKSWYEMFLLGVSLAVAAIPAGLPVVMTVALAIGVRRMAERHAVIRHLPAVETLGSTTAILSDKTGTLTQNRMTVQRIEAGSAGYDVTGGALAPGGEIARDGETVAVEEGTPLFDTLLVGLLDNDAEVEVEHGEAGESSDDSEREATTAAEYAREDTSGSGRMRAEEKRQRRRERREREREHQRKNRQTQFHPQGDPMEAALLIAAMKAGLSRDGLLNLHPQIDEVPFRTEQRFSATVHETEDGQRSPLVVVKGAPERILGMCERQMNDEGETEDLDAEGWRRRQDELASRGLRVLAMAIGRGDEAAKAIHDENPSGFTFVGMQGLMDPPRSEAVEAVDRCHAAGIRVMMVTGDHARTASAIAHQVHLDRPVGTDGAAVDGETLGGDEGEGGEEATPSPEELPEVHAGRELAEMDDGRLDDVLRRGNVYARVKPDQKLRLVERLKQQNQIVAVTGDGVNDAPALKAAHLGAAMGRTGTDVAKEASDMVITDDNFASVYSAVEAGRTAFRNIRMATFFLLSTGAADVVIILFALGMGWPLPLLPAQILWCNVVTNGIADVALGFEPGERALFRRPPRPPGEGILDRVLLERLVIVGLWLAAGTLGVFYWIYTTENVDLARVAALTTLVLFQKVHVFNCRSEDVSVFKKSLLANKVLLLGVTASLIVHVAALYIPWTQDLLSFQPLSWQIWLVAIGVASTAIVVNELHKRFRPRDRIGDREPARSETDARERDRTPARRNERPADEGQVVQRDHERHEELAERKAEHPG